MLYFSNIKKNIFKIFEYGIFGNLKSLGEVEYLKLIGGMRRFLIKRFDFFLEIHKM